MIFLGPIGMALRTWPYRAPAAFFWLGILYVIYSAASQNWSWWMLLYPGFMSVFALCLFRGWGCSSFGEFWDKGSPNWRGAKAEWLMERDWVKMVGEMAHQDLSDFNNVVGPEFVSCDFRDYFRDNSTPGKVTWIPAPGAKSLGQSSELFHRQLIQKVSGDQESSALHQDEPDLGKPRAIISLISSSPLKRPEPLRGVIVSPTRAEIDKMKKGGK